MNKPEQNKVDFPDEVAEFCPVDPSPLPTDEQFIFWRDEDGDYLLKVQREGEYLTAHGSTPEDAVWNLRKVLDLAAQLKATPEPAKCGEEFLATGQERGVCQLPKKHKGSHDNTVRRAEPPSEASGSVTFDQWWDESVRLAQLHLGSGDYWVTKGVAKKAWDAAKEKV